MNKENGIFDAFVLTVEQATEICKAMKVDTTTLADWEIAEVVDKFIDMAIGIVKEQ